MCQQVTVIHRLDESRFVWRCEHETIHINWGKMALHLRPDDFGRVVRLLERGVIDLTLTQICEDQRCGLARQEDGHYQLWFGDVILLLNTADFLEFVHLTRSAKKSLPH